MPAKPDFEGTPPDIDEWVKTTHVEAYSDDDRMNTAQWEIGKIEEVSSEIGDLMNETLEEGLFDKEIKTDVWERDKIEEVPAAPAGMDATSQLEDFSDEEIKTDQWEINRVEEKPTDIDEMVMTTQVGSYSDEDQMNTAQWEIGKIGVEGETGKNESVLEDSVESLLFSGDLEDLSSADLIFSASEEDISGKKSAEEPREKTVEPQSPPAGSSNRPGSDSHPDWQNVDSFLDSVQDETGPLGGPDPNSHPDAGWDRPGDEGFSSEDFLAMGTNNKEKKSTSGGHDPDEFLESLLEEESEGKPDTVQKQVSQVVPASEADVGDDFDLSDFADVEKKGKTPSSQEDVDSLFDSIASANAQVPAKGSRSPSPAEKKMEEDLGLLDSFSSELTPGKEILESLKTDLATDLASQDATESAVASPKPATSLEEDLFEGFGNETASRSSTPKPPPAKSAAGMDLGEIEALFPGDAAEPKKSPNAKGGSTESRKGQDDLDALLSSLDFSPKDQPQIQTGPGAGGAGESAVGQDDLDSLLAGAATAGGSTKGRSGSDDLENLLSTLESEEGGGGGRAPEGAGAGMGADEIDDLLASSTSSGGGSSDASSDDFHGDIDELMTASLDDMGDDIFDTDSHAVPDFDMASGAMMDAGEFMDDSHMMDSSMIQTAPPEEAPPRPARPAARKESEEEFDVSQAFEEEKKAGEALPFLQKALAPIKNLFSKLPLKKKSTEEEFAEPDEMVLDAQKLEREIKSDQPAPRKPTVLTRYVFPGIAAAALVLAIGYVVLDLTGPAGPKKRISKPRSPETTGFMMQKPKAGGESTQATGTQTGEEKNVSVAALSGQTPIKKETPLDVLASRTERMAEPPKEKAGASSKSGKEEKPEAPAVPKEFFEGTQSTGATQVAAESAKKASIKLGAILPIEMNAESTRILVVNVILELDSQNASKYVSERIPIYQGIVEDSIQDFFADKFYEETNYAQEKLQQFLLDSLNKDKRFGKVNSVRLADFKVS